jgi:hypothetical protein
MVDQPNFVTLEDLGLAAPAQPNPVQTPASSTAPAPVPAPAPAATPAQAPGFVSPEDLGLPAQPPRVSTAEDIARTVAAEGTKGFISDTGGLIGAAAYYTQPELTEAQLEDLYRELTPDQILDIQEGKLTAIPVPRETSPYKVLPMGGMGMIAPSQAGKAFNLVPTMQGGAEGLEENLPYTTYEAQGEIANIIGAGTRAVAGTLPLAGPKAIAPAFVAGSSGRAVGDLTQALSGSETLSGGTEIATNVLVDALSRQFGKVATDLAAPNRSAMQKIAESISLSLAKNPEKKRLLIEAVRSGRPINVNDFIDDKTRTWLSKNLPGDYAHQILSFESGLAARKSLVDQETTNQFKTIFGEDLSDNGWAIALQNAQEVEAGRLYGATRANPAASNLFTPDLQKLIGQGGVIKDAAIEVAEAARKGDLGPDIVPLGIKSGPKGKVIITAGSAPNFDYWDQVKRNLDAKANEFYEKKNTFKGKIYSDAAKSVRDKVSDVIGEYPAARAAGQQAIQTPTALEEGYNFARTLTGTKLNLEKVDDFVQQYDAANANQKLRMQQGVGRGLLQIGQSGDFKQISRLMSSPGSRKALEKILGPNKFQEVYGLIGQNALMKNTTELAGAAQNQILNGQASKNPVLRDMLISFTTGGGAAGLAAYAQSGSAMMKGAALAALTSVAFLTKAGLDAKERRIAGRVMELALSEKPEDARRLGQLLSTDISAVTALRKTNQFVTNSVRSGFLAAAREEDQKRKVTKKTEAEYNFVTPDSIPGFNDGQAAGGRIERKFGGRVANAISTEVTRTRALLSNKTASMLSMPDDAIVTALNHAKNT